MHVALQETIEFIDFLQVATCTAEDLGNPPRKVHFIV